MPRYQDITVRQSKPRLDYDVGGSSARYGDTYSERLVGNLRLPYCFFALCFRLLNMLHIFALIDLDDHMWDIVAVDLSLVMIQHMVAAVMA